MPVTITPEAHAVQTHCTRVTEEESVSWPDNTDDAIIFHMPYRIAIKAKSRMAPRRIDRAIHYSDNSPAQRIAAWGLYSFKPR